MLAMLIYWCSSYGRVACSDADVETAAKQAEIHDFICTLPEGYDTQLGGTAGGGQAVHLWRVIVRVCCMVWW